MTYEFDPLTGDPMPKSNGKVNDVVPGSNAITEAQLAKLDAMSRDDLIALVRRMACQCGLVAAMSEEETARAMLDRLAEEALKRSTQGRDAISTINAWLDRKQGKPIARTVAEVSVASVSVQADVALLSRIKRDLIEGRLLLDDTSIG